MTSAILGDFDKAAQLCPKVLGQDAKRWEDWIFLFVEQKQLPVRMILLKKAASTNLRTTGHYPLHSY